MQILSLAKLWSIKPNHRRTGPSFSLWCQKLLFYFVGYPALWQACSGKWESQQQGVELLLAAVARGGKGRRADGCITRLWRGASWRGRSAWA